MLDHPEPKKNEPPKETPNILAMIRQAQEAIARAEEQIRKNRELIDRLKARHQPPSN